MVGNTAVNDSKGVLLHFQAKQIREAALGDLVATHRRAHVSVVIISGGSAGGLAAFLHADWWCDSLAEKSAGLPHKCVALPDSGFFLDYESPRAAAGPPPPSYHAGYYRSILALPPSTPQSVTRFGTTPWKPSLVRCRPHHNESAHVRLNCGLVKQDGTHS